MAYLTGTASSPIDLLQQLVTWLQGRGWTSNMSQTEGAGWRAHLSKGSVYVNLRAAVNENISYSAYNNQPGYGLAMNVGTGFSGASSWRNQAGAPQYAGAADGVFSCLRLPVSNITAYHFFDDGGDNITVVVEATPTIFGHLGWGNLIKAGTWAGGAYSFGDRGPWYMFNTALVEGYTVSAACPFVNGDGGNYPISYVRADVDTVTGKWITVCASGASGSTHASKFARSPVKGGSGHLAPTGLIPAYGGSFGIPFQDRQFSSFNSQVMFLPIDLYVDRDAGGCSLLGRVPGIYTSLAVANGIPPASVLQIGADNYMVFPNFAVRKA